MSANSTPERATSSDNEMAVVEDDKKLNDPTGFYADAYARAGKAIQTSSSPAPAPRQSSQQPDHKRYQQSRSRAPSPTLDSILSSGLPRRQVGYHRRQDTARLQEHKISHYRDRRETPSEEFMECQTPVVARVISRHSAPYQSGTMNIPAGIHPSTFRPQHHGPSSQHNTSDFEIPPPRLVNQPTPHRSRQTSHYNISEFEQSPPYSVRPSQRRQLDPVQYQDIEYGDQGSSRELGPYHSKHTKEGQAMNGQRQLNRMGSYDSVEDGDDSGLFVPDGHDRSYRVEKAGSRSQHRFSHDNFAALDNVHTPRPGQLPRDQYFNNPGNGLGTSRYAGAQNNWGVNAKPVLVPQELVTDAALLKRGLKRGKEDKVCKRGYGANDPENIAIVNMYEKDGMSFEEIKSKLNADRVATGRTPSLSANGCHSRYNRTAPLLFTSEGREFIPLSQRGGRGKRCEEILTGKPAWNEDLDTQLVVAVKQWESTRWQGVAQVLKENTGVDMDPEACAHRHHMI